jgi:hypothetical protein
MSSCYVPPRKRFYGNGRGEMFGDEYVMCEDDKYYIMTRASKKWEVDNPETYLRSGHWTEIANPYPELH